MRRLHPVLPAESFVASGVYRYTALGEVEHWSVHGQPGGALLLRVDRDRRAVDGRSLLIEAWATPAGAVERFSLRAYGGPGDSFRVARADFVLNGLRVEVGHSLDGAPRQDSVLALPAPACACPDAVSFRGQAVRCAVRQASSVVLVTHTAFDGEQPFSGAAVPAASLPVWAESGAVSVDGREIPAQRWRWPGVPGFDGELWLDAHGAVLRHTRPDAVEITLARYARRMEPGAHD